jgi:hypothetical protein
MRTSQSSAPAAADTGADLPQAITYARFGEQFFLHAVTEQRVLGAVASLAGRPIEFGPVGVGPAGLVKVSASGNVGEPGVQRQPGELVAFLLTIPVALQLLIDLGPERSRFTAEVSVRLRLTARPAEPLAVVIDIEPPSAKDVEVRVQADGVRASVLQLVGGVDSEVRRAVARYACRELEQPAVQSARVIDVAAIIARAEARTSGRA